jgi:hypothetical protein
MWASTKEPVEHTGKITLILAGKEQGKAAFLTICKVDSENYLLEHFDENWITMGASFYKSLGKAKEVAERAYRNISQQWIETKITEEEALAELNRMDENRICSFCRSRMIKDNLPLFTIRQFAICHQCLTGFYDMLKEKNAEDKTPQTLDNLSEDQICSFCRSRIVKSSLPLFGVNQAAICHQCVTGFYRMLKDNSENKT